MHSDGGTIVETSSAATFRWETCEESPSPDRDLVIISINQSYKGQLSEPQRFSPALLLNIRDALHRFSKASLALRTANHRTASHFYSAALQTSPYTAFIPNPNQHQLISITPLLETADSLICTWPFGCVELPLCLEPHSLRIYLDGEKIKGPIVND